LATDLELTLDSALRVDSAYAYWSQSVLAGSIQRCPLTGCSGKPEFVVSSVRSPTSLLLDQQKLYFQHETDAFQYALSSCTIGQCDTPDLLAAGIDSSTAMAVDDEYVYVSTTSQDLSLRFPSDAPAVQIRRFAK
jgi:hypothetical protein